MEATEPLFDPPENLAGEPAVSMIEAQYESLGLLNIHVHNRDPTHPLAYIFTQARAIHPWGVHLAFVAALVLVVSGRIPPRRPHKGGPIVSLVMSFLWAGQTLLVLRDTCPSLDRDACHIVYTSLAGLFAFQSLVFLVGGVIFHNSFFYHKFSFMSLGYERVVGTVLVVYSFLSCLGHYQTGGLFFLLGFPLDAFTLGLLLSCATYAPVLTYFLPLVSCGFRAVNTLTAFGLSGEWGLLACALLAAVWVTKRHLYPHPKPSLSHHHRNHPSNNNNRHHFQHNTRGNRSSHHPHEDGGDTVRPHTIPLLQEVQGHGAAADMYRGQGQSAVEAMMEHDSDGDSAHEFWEATEDGRFVRVQSSAGGGARSKTD